MKLLKLLSVIVIATLMAACSSDEEPKQSTSGEEIAARFNNVLLGENSKWLIPDGNNDNVLYAATIDHKSARNLAAAVIGDPAWSADKKAYTLPEGYGNVSVREGDTEGVLLTMAFNVKTMKPLTLNIVTLDYIRNLSNVPLLPNWTKEIAHCLDCDAVFPKMYLVKKEIYEEHSYTVWYECPLCGSRNFLIDAGGN